MVENHLVDFKKLFPKNRLLRYPLRIQKVRSKFAHLCLVFFSFKKITKSKGMPCNSTVLPEESVLDQFCVDLTARASEGLIDPVIGRDTEVQRIIQILCRRSKNNPILLGESGVGKTAIVEGLAIRIAQADVPAFLLVCSHI